MANIELDGANKKIKVDSGDLTLDVPGDIILDADGGDVVVADGGTNILKVTNSSSDVVLQPQVDAKDIIFKQYDGTTVATVEDNGTFNIPASKLAIGGTAVTSTAAELNLLDGGTSVGGSITLADGDGVVVNDGGTMKTIPASDVKTYAGGAITALNNATENELVSVGSTTTELDAESSLTTDGSTLTIKPGSNVHQLKLEQDNATDYWSLHADSSGGPLSFQRYTGGAETEKARINSNGTISIGNTGSAASSFSDTGDVGVYLSPTSSTGASTFAMSGDQPLTINRSDDNNDNSTLVGLRRRNEVCGTIKGTNNTAQYNTSSDYRLKENVNYTWDATTRLKQLKPAIFNWISDETNTAIDGFIAHEVTPVVPQATSGEKDAVDSEGKIDPQGMDHSKLVPLLTKALQEAITKIETLEARVTTLEG
jgi:hypothetical protein